MKIGIIGSGLIGGSIGLATKARHPGAHVTVFDADSEVASRAVARGAADDAVTDPLSAVTDADLVFIATPVGAIAQLAGQVAQSLKSTAVLTDVGSTKSRVVVDVERSLPSGSQFVGGHPMAGSEEEGVDAADAALFEGAAWILTPTDRSSPDAYRALHSFLITLGARVLALDPQRHDELMAVISHVPQLTATALMNLAATRGRADASVLALAAGGFRDLTRVAGSNPAIWADICRENADAIASVLDDLTASLVSMRDSLRASDIDRLRAALEAGREARRALPGKQVGGALYEVVVPIPDRPGVLASVTTSVGAIGINIEDLQIVHSTEGGRGLLHVLITGEKEAARVADTLRTRGFEPRVAALGG